MVACHQHSSSKLVITDSLKTDSSNKLKINFFSKMKAFVASLLFIVSVPAAITTSHTTCDRYFRQKDGCVFSSTFSQDRCLAPKKDHPSPIQPSFPIGSGKGICGLYDSTKEIGVCLWSGAEQTNPTEETAGWLNGLNTYNCGKRIYIQRTGRPETVQYAKVLDGCSFNTQAPDVGCFEVGLSIELFNLFNPTEKEKADQLLYGGITWDFDNLDDQSPQQGPV